MKKRGKKKVLLLGAAGRIGAGFIEEYLKKYKKYYELILGVHSKKFKDKRFRVFRTELTDVASLKRVMKNVDVVINLAANPRVDATFSAQSNNVPVLAEMESHFSPPSLTVPYFSLKSSELTEVAISSAISFWLGQMSFRKTSSPSEPTPTG